MTLLRARLPILQQAVRERWTLQRLADALGVTTRERARQLLRDAGLVKRSCSVKDFCLNGHPMSGENLQPMGKYRRCKACHNSQANRRYAKGVRSMVV